MLWPLTDNQGTVRDLVNNSGTTQNHIKYNSFGRVTSETNGAIDHRFGYTGRELDEETGLYYYRTRYYDPVVGRFISEDPIGFEAEDVNLYRYVGNSPVNWIDPMGTRIPVAPPPMTTPKSPGVPLWLIPFVAIPGSPFNPLPVNKGEDEFLRQLKCNCTEGNKGKWTCTASCNVQQIDRRANCPPRVTGFGSGPNQDEACVAAKRAATQSTPRGCYPRHCKCDCRKN